MAEALIPKQEMNGKLDKAGRAILPVYQGCVRGPTLAEVGGIRRGAGPQRKTTDVLVSWPSSWLLHVARFVRGRYLSAIFLVTLELGLLGLLAHRPLLEVALHPSQIHHVAGYQYFTELPALDYPGYRLLTDTFENPTQSLLILLQDGNPIGPPHSSHDSIKTAGNGAYSHWGRALQFSAPGNTDPRIDGHAYTVRAELVLDHWWLFVFAAGFGAVPLVIAAVSLAYAIYSPALRIVVVCCLLLVEASILFLLVWNPTLDAIIARGQIATRGGNIYYVTVSNLTFPGYQLLGDNNEHPTRSSLSVLRNGLPLGPAHSVHEVIAKGAFSHWQDTLFFSTPGNTDPRSDGSIYAIRAKLKPSPGLLVVLAFAFTVLAIPLLPTLKWIASEQRFVVTLKFVGIFLVFSREPSAWWSSISKQTEQLVLANRLSFLVIYFTLLIASFAALAGVSFLRDWRVRVPLASILLLAFGTNQIIWDISGQQLSVDMLQTLWRERAMAADAIGSYSSSLLTNLTWVGLLLLLFALPAPQRYSMNGYFGLWPVATLIVITVCARLGYAAPADFPSSYAVLGQLTTIFSSEDSDHVERSAVEYNLPVRSFVKKIVMIVDESVRGDYLGLNNSKFDNSPYLKKVAGILGNYGIAVSAANCSAASRVIMRLGLQKDQLPDLVGIWRKLPGVFAYATKAGFKTVLIDGNRPFWEFHSYMDVQEERSIQKIRGGPPTKDAMYERDMIVADQLLETLDRDEATFIYVNKWGVHPDYSLRFPPDFSYDPSALVSSLPLDAKRRDSVRDYHKALRWSVDHFFERVLPALQRPDTVTIYTSDHGQSLFEGGYDLSHCSLRPDLAHGEVFVPLFVLAGSPELRSRFQAAATRSFSRASHFEVFPTLLELMGYSQRWVEKAYGGSLLNVPIERRRGFLLGTFNRPGATWINVDEASTSALTERSR
jgi:glucan phosphoethanolaminetransferase (alkaline phosphatase superfamily)